MIKDKFLYVINNEIDLWQKRADGKEYISKRINFCSVQYVRFGFSACKGCSLLKTTDVIKDTASPINIPLVCFMARKWYMLSTMYYKKKADDPVRLKLAKEILDFWIDLRDNRLEKARDIYLENYRTLIEGRRTK